MTMHPDTPTYRGIDNAYSRATVNALLAAFGNNGGPAGLSLNKNGVCHLQDGDDRIISVIHKTDTASLVLIAPVALRYAPTPELLKMLLKANARIDATCGGMFAVTQAGGALQFFSRIGLADLSPRVCLNKIREFSNLVQSFESQIRAFEASVYQERHATRH